jgi:hypothetical protein
MLSEADAYVSRHELNTSCAGPVDIRALAVLDGFQVWERGDVLSRHGVVALYVPDHHDRERPNVIIIDEGLSSGLQRYGIAHELGHHYLRHWPSVVRGGQLCTCYDIDSRNVPFFDYESQQQELEAAAFAAEVLIPSSMMVVDTYEELADACDVPLTVAVLRSRMYRQGLGGWRLGAG